MDESSLPKKGIFYGWWIVAASFVVLFVFAGAGFYSFSIFIKPLEDSFGWSRSAISFAMSIYLIVHGISGPMIGHWTEKYGPKRTMTFFGIGCGIAFILVSFTNSLWYFYGIYALLSLMTTGIGFIPVSVIISRWFVKRRGTAIGISMVGISFGGMTLSPVINYIISVTSWRMSFVFLGIMVWVLVLPLSLFVIKGHPAEKGLLPDGEEKSKIPEQTEISNTPSVVAEQGWPLKAAIKTNAFFWICVTYFLAPLAQMGVLQHQVPIITGIGISTAAAATALGFTAGLGGLGKLSFGRISEIVPFRYAAMLCFGLQALGVFVLYRAGSLATVWVYVLIFGFAMGGIIVLLPMVVGQFFGLRAFGIIMGIISFSQAIGSAIGAIMSGFIYDKFGSYEYALVVYIAIYLTATLSIFLAGKPKEYVQRA